MHTGMMWYDGAASSPFGRRLQTATSYYLRKFRRAPNLCLVHPGLLGAAQGTFGTITVRAYSALPPGHFWIGFEDSPKRRGATA
jgi:hypothetical protein